MPDKKLITVARNKFNGTWEVGWKWKDGTFTPRFCGFKTKKEAEAQIPGFDARCEEEYQAFKRKRDAEEQEQNERWPNIGHARAEIAKLAKREPLKALNAKWDLEELLDHELHERVTWPLPSLLEARGF